MHRDAGAQGLVILDTNVYKKLESVEIIRSMESSLRAAQLVAWPSSINAFELSLIEPAETRQRMLETVKVILGENVLLPWPTILLQELAAAAADGRSSVKVIPTFADALVHDSDAAVRERDEVVEIIESLENGFNLMHANAREEIQAFLKSEGLRSEWDSAGEFLDRLWMTSHMAGSFAELFWTRLKLSGNVPSTLLLQIPAWRMFLEIEGLGVFERAVVQAQPKRVHRLDLLQLVYLGRAGRGILVTDDKPLQRAAFALLNRRHTATRVMSSDEFLASF